MIFRTTAWLASIGSAAAAALLTVPPAHADWRPATERVGDPAANYLNVEVTPDNRYMVWFEGATSPRDPGTVWHCEIDQRTGALIPPDCRGFAAFETNGWARANPGLDARGVYYVGADAQGRLVMVRPAGARDGAVTVLSTPADTLRRALYPSVLPGVDEAYVFMIRNERTPGAGVRPLNNWVELQYVDLNAPHEVHVIERQTTPARAGAPMDVGFVRWVRGLPVITYGFTPAGSNVVETRAFDVADPARGSYPLIVDGVSKIDPYGALIGEDVYVLAGADRTARSLIYRQDHGAGPFARIAELFPDGSALDNPSLAQSHEPFARDGRIYTVYQVNERGDGFVATTFRNPGEIWLADLSASPALQWRIAPLDGGPIAEPEPVMGETCVWVFYTRPLVEEAATEASAREDSPWLAGRRGRRARRAGRAGGFAAIPRLALYRAETPLCGP